MNSETIKPVFIGPIGFKLVKESEKESNKKEENIKRGKRLPPGGSYQYYRVPEFEKMKYISDDAVKTCEHIIKDGEYRRQLSYDLTKHFSEHSGKDLLFNGIRSVVWDTIEWLISTDSRGLFKETYKKELYVIMCRITEQLIFGEPFTD